MQTILSADRSCDLNDELQQRYSVNYIYSPINLGDQRYTDSLDIFPDDFFRAFEEKGILPKTECINVAAYLEYFRQWTDKGQQVVHICLSSGLSGCYQNACIAADMLEGVYVIDSHTLSTAAGLLVIEAAERIAKGMSAQETAEEVRNLTQYAHCSFVLDTLAYMKAGGRCSAMAAAGANLLNIKPCIEADPIAGTLGVGKKYRGSLDKVLLQYTQDRLTRYDDIRPERVFITHSGISQERIDIVKNCLTESGKFREIHITRASGIISSHCGPNCLGVLYMTGAK